MGNRELTDSRVAWSGRTARHKHEGNGLAPKSFRARALPETCGKMVRIKGLGGIGYALDLGDSPVSRK